MKPSDIPPKGHSDRKAFIDNEINKSIYGITVNGIFIPGGLYWEFNHWKIPVDIEVKGVIKKEILTPQLRDNSWIIHNAYEEATKQKKILVIGGARQISKTVTLTSLLGRQILLFENTNSLGLYSNTKDIEVTNAYLDVGLANVSEFLSLPVLDKDPKKGLMRIGFKQKDNTNYVYSSLYLRNTDEGKNTEIGAGLTLNFFAFDEIAKHSCAKAIEAVKPALISEFGWRCAPLFCFCVCVGTKVWNNNGELVNIENLITDNGIIGFDRSQGSYSKEDITYYQDPLQKPCYRIETAKGTFLECSFDHPILYRSRDETYGDVKRRGQRKIYFKPCKDLKVGNQIALIEEVPIFSDKKMWNPRLVGLLIGDGSYGKDKTPRLANCDKEVLDYVESNFDVVFERGHLTIDGRDYKEIRIRGICQYLRELGIYTQTKHQKTLPENIHSFDKESICEMLGGFYDADGHITHTGIALTSMSKPLLYEVKLLLIKLGIHSNIHNKPIHKTNLLAKNPCFSLHVEDRKSVLKFKENITFLVKEKQRKLDLVCDKLQSKKNQIPQETKGLRFERIVSIVDIGIKDVYNLTANNTNTYIANGIVTHNTGGNVEKSKDAENFFMFPEANNVLPFENEGKKTGLFIGGWYRQDFKRETSLSKYLNVEQGSELDEVKIKVTDFEKANTVLDQEQLDLSKDPDKSKLLKHRMYFPRSIQEMFLSESENPYPRELVEQQIKLLESNPIGTAVELYRDNSTKEVKHKLSSKLVNTQFPNPDWKLFQDAPIVIYDFPKYKDTYGLHFIGCLPPGEKVMTDKGLKNVEEISLIDKLINTEGNQVDIFNLQQYNVTDEAVYEIKIANTLRTTKFTKEHPILVSENKTGYVSINRYKREGLKQRYKKLDFKFKPVSEVKIKDWVKVPNIYIKEVKPDYEQLWNEITCNNCNKLKNPLQNKDFWWLIGLWLGDGWTEKDRVAFVFNKKEPYYISKFIEVCKSLFDKDIIVGKDKESCAEYYISSIKLNLFLTKHFGRYADGKKISEWVKYLKPEFKKELLRGYLNSDGYVGISKTKQLLNIGFVSINLELLEAIQDILFSLGIISNMSLLRNEKTHFFGKKLCNTKKCYQLRLGHTDSQILLNSIYDGQDHKINKVKKIDFGRDVHFKNCFFSTSLDYIYFQIKQINKSQYSGKVYNFECDTHTYMCHHIPTHNCDTYNDDQVSHSDSLGSIHVYRKEHADLTDDFRGCMVASYIGRPKSAKEFNEIALMLTEFYNGMVLYEHVTPSLLEYYDGKNKTHMLIDTYDLQKTININTKTLNKKGLKPTTANQKFLLNSELGYLTEELEDGYGIRRIYDLYLLRQYLVDRDKNTDAIISNQHAIAALNMFAKMNVKIDDGQEYEYNPIRNAFGFGMKSSSDTKKRNAFGI